MHKQNVIMFEPSILVLLEISDKTNTKCYEELVKIKNRSRLVYKNYIKLKEKLKSIDDFIRIMNNIENLPKSKKTQLTRITSSIKRMKFPPKIDKTKLNKKLSPVS